jgi:hypothetical protein
LILAPHQAPRVAFSAGVAGPLIGADLLHLKNIQGIPRACSTLAEPAPSTGLSFRGSLRPVWHKSRATFDSGQGDIHSSVTCICSLAKWRPPKLPRRSGWRQNGSRNSDGQ